VIPINKNLVFGLLFFFPSIVFWTSGIHKDGISIAAIGLILYFSAEIRKTYLSGHITQKLHLLAGLLIGLWLLGVVRVYLLILLMPCIIAYHFTKPSKYSTVKFVSVLVVFYLLLLNLKFLNTDLDFLNIMATQQEAYYTLTTNTNTLELMRLNENPNNFFPLLFQSVINCLTQPLPWQVNSAIQIIPALDNIFIMMLIIAAMLFSKRQSSVEHLFFVFSLVFAVSIFVFVGSIVPVVGALVRYKMPGTLFLAFALLISIDVFKIRALFRFAKV
jgi:hypothetical protein